MGRKLKCEAGLPVRVGLIGAGAISTRVAELLKNFDLNVIVVPSRRERRHGPASKVSVA